FTILNEHSINEGFVSRFTIIEYKGKRPKRNKTNTNAQPSFQLVDKVAALVSQCLNLNSQNRSCQIKYDDDALKMLDDFDELCDDKIINATDSEKMFKELWDRGHLEALIIAGLVAVGCNYINPKVDAQCAEWAINLVKHELSKSASKIENGDAGSNNDES